MYHYLIIKAFFDFADLKMLCLYEKMKMNSPLAQAHRILTMIKCKMQKPNWLRLRM